MMWLPGLGKSSSQHNGTAFQTCHSASGVPLCPFTLHQHLLRAILGPQPVEMLFCLCFVPGHVLYHYDLPRKQTTCFKGTLKMIM